MLTKNRPEGFLPVMERMREGEMKLCYDISSRQSLERLYENKGMNLEDLKRLFSSWEEAAKTAERFLLAPSFLVCDPQFVFLNPSDRKAEWVCYPKETEERYPEDVKLLAEYVLEKVDREDATAVKAAYEFYKSVREDTFLLPEMLRYLREISDEVQTMESDTPSTIPEEPLSYADNNSGEENWTIQKKEGIFQTIGRVIKNLFGMRPSKTDRKEEVVSTKTIPEIIREDHSWMEQEEECSQTVLLSEEGEETRELHSLKDGRRICLDPLPVTIGKMKKEVDLYLDSPGISRFHAKIFESDGSVWVEDTNSKNGVTINDKRLSAFEKARLTPGDRIYFAKEGFIFH
jgi:hypothetical protein